MKKKILIILIILFTMIFVLFLIRYFSETQLDDVNPLIQCDKKLLEKSDVLFVIPIFKNQSIANNPEWCRQILSLNKTLGLHGVYHTYYEFLTDRNSEYLNKGIIAFEKCFGYKPTSFKPPQLKISKTNKKLIKNNLKLKLIFNQIFHKVYHCNDTGRFSNKFIDLF